MTMPTSVAPRSFRLEDRFAASPGPVPLTGVQAVCRVPLDARRVDARHGLNTRAFVSGYQGSPLGTVDFSMRPIARLLEEHGVDFRPGMNEMLAATAVAGTQSVPNIGSDLSGVTGFWYGKAPGVDQALDAIRHGNLMGAHPDGGVLAFCGDDATAKSSTVPSGSETVLRAALVPTLVAADSQDVLDFGLHGVALSRATGAWAALKVATHVADASGIVWPNPDLFEPVLPLLEGNRYRHTVTAGLIAAVAERMEQNLHQVRIPLAVEYARLNGLNRVTQSGPADRIGIVAVGQPYLELRQALAEMGLADGDALASLGIRTLKLGMIWPLEPSIVREFAEGLEEIIVIEDKGPFLEHLLKAELFNHARHPRVLGTSDQNGAPLLPAFGSVDADAITKALAPRLLAIREVASVRARLIRVAAPPRLSLTVVSPKRAPYFCSGCPHNTSTKAPDGALVGAGIGCHGMATLMDSDQVGAVTGLTQMGGEGAQWIGQQPYVDADHCFQNLGDGTLAHSGLLAIRASVAAGTNVTYKILYNATVAMTGGQDAVGGYSVPQLVKTLTAEGVERIIVTTETPRSYRRLRSQRIVSVRHKDSLIGAQEELRQTPGTTILIHDQPCAAELRRNRKRGLAPDPEQRVLINERLCEGCGDCGKKSNCLSVLPVQTEFGRKTQIHQSSCNKDYSCLDGDCPSFMVVIPSGRAAPKSGRAPVIESGSIPDPKPLFEPNGYAARITGIGGTGIVTIAQVMITAAYLDGLNTRGLDQVGLSQKAGAVVSDVKFAQDARPFSPKVAIGECDLYLGCDLLVAADTKNLATASRERTVAIVSTANVPTGDMIRHPETAFPDSLHGTQTIDAATRSELNTYVDAKALAESLFGSDQFANMILMGSAYQAGAIPLTEQSIEQAIGLNGVATETNLQAFRHGRLLVADPSASTAALADLRPSPGPARVFRKAAELIERVDAAPHSKLSGSLEVRIPDLIDYQNVAYAERYSDVVAQVRRAETRRGVGCDDFSEAVAFYLHKLMAYKDEYEVARLSLDKAQQSKIDAEFGTGAKVVWKLHPPVLRALGMKRKVSLGRWFTPAYVLLRWMTPIRGTMLDPFGHNEIRRLERELVREYVAIVDDLCSELTLDNYSIAVRIAELPDLIRGYENIKLKSVEAYRRTLDELLSTFRAEGSRPAER